MSGIEIKPCYAFGWGEDSPRYVHSSLSSPLLSKFKDKFFHWLIGVKCPKFSHLNLSFYFNLLSHFPTTLSCHFIIIFYSLVVIVSSLFPSFSVHVISLPTSLTHTPLPFQRPSTKLQNSARFCYSFCHLLSAHPSFLSTLLLYT